MKENIVIEEKIIKLYKEGKTQSDIAKEVEYSKSTVSRIIKRLIEEGKLKKGSIYKEEKIIKLYKEGKTQSNIAKEVEYSQQNVSKIIKRLIEEGKLEKRKSSIDKEEKIIKLYKEGKKQSNIAKKVEYSKSTVSKIIKRLIEEGKLENSSIYKEEKIIKLYKEGKKQSNIAKEVEYSKSTVGRIIKRLIEEGKLEKRKLKRKIVIDKETEEKIINSIARKTKRVDNILNTLEMSKENIETIHEYVQEVKKSSKKEKISEDTLDRIEQSVIFLDTHVKIGEVIFLINTYIKAGRYNDAIKTINNILTIKKWEKSEEDKLIKGKRDIETHLKKIKAIEMIKIGMETKEIARITNLSEIIIIELKNKYINKQSKSKPEAER